VARTYVSVGCSLGHCLEWLHGVGENRFSQWGRTLQCDAVCTQGLPEKLWLRNAREALCDVHIVKMPDPPIHVW
jgi:hypothetical protein